MGQSRIGQYVWSKASAILFACLVLLLPACAGTFGGNNAHESAEINTRLGMGYLQQGRIDDAIDKLKKALDADWDFAEAHSTIALAYVQTGQFDLAEKHYLKAIDLKPDDGAGYNNYGVFLCQHDRLQEADAYFMKAIQTPRYHTPERAYENAGACARRIPDLDKAENYLRQALSRDPKLPTALYEMAEISFAQKHLMSTRAYLQRFEEVSRHSPQSLWLGVRAERELGDKAAAAHYAKLLQTQYPDSMQFKWLLESETSTQGSMAQGTTGDPQK